MRIGLVVVAVTASGCAYHPGSYAVLGERFDGERVQFACLDLAVARATDAYAEGPVVSYAFGNRCERHIDVDLASVRAVGRDAGGAEVPLVAYDPRHELRVARLDGLWASREWIEYHAPAGVELAAVCVDVGRAEPDAPLGERWVCMASGGAP